MKKKTQFNAIYLRRDSISLVIKPEAMSKGNQITFIQVINN
jgi:hypothetical protein